MKFKNINYREIVRNDFDVLHNKERHKISATALRHALENQDYELAKKFLPNSI
ncbi:hypothetical protein HOG21_01960 [bacterium]|nr:hypothetical protein [bacterium]